MRNKATKKNMDLDLRRYGKMLYTKAEESGGSGGSDGDDSGDSVDINTILDNISIKDDLLTKLQAIDYTNQDEDGVLTNLTFDDVFNDYNDFIKQCFYREEIPFIKSIQVIPTTVIKEDYGMSLRIPGGIDVSYNIFIVNENNDINIYVLKTSAPEPA